MPLKSASLKSAPSSLRFRKIAISQIRLAHVRAAQIGVAEFRSAQVGFPQVASREVRSGQIAFLQIRAGKIGAGKIGAFAARMPLMEFLVRVQDVLQLLAFVSNGLRLPRLFLPSQNSPSSPLVHLQLLWFALLFYRKPGDDQIECDV